MFAMSTCVRVCRERFSCILAGDQLQQSTNQHKVNGGANSFCTNPNPRIYYLPLAPVGLYLAPFAPVPHTLVRTYCAIHVL